MYPKPNLKTLKLKPNLLQGRCHSKAGVSHVCGKNLLLVAAELVEA